MLSQDDINKMYEDDIGNRVLSEDMVDLMAELDRVKALKAAGPKKVKFTFKGLAYGLIYFALNKFLSLIVWAFNKVGVK
jgi:hypothetical protein